MRSSLPLTNSSAAHGRQDQLWDGARDALLNLWRKAQLLALGLLHLLFSSDQHIALSSGAANGCNTSYAPPPGANGHAKPKRIVFVRHAESEWNVVFNRGGAWLAVAARLLRALLREWRLLPAFDSLFIDSPLSRRGVRQAEALAEHVALACEEPAAAPPPAHWLRYLGRAQPDSVVVASNLRRAIDTARVVSASRLDVPGERIHVLSSLQEIGRNIDTLALSDAHGLPALTLPPGARKRNDELFNVAESHGNKAVRGSARERLDAFAAWALAQPRDVVVVYGHSHWFRAFCRAFFPAQLDHPLKRDKLSNCAVVAFELQRAPNGDAAFVIAPQSFQYVR